MSLEIRVAQGCQPTGRILGELLTERGLTVVESGGDAVVSYGVKYTGSKPSLNANAGGHTKLDELGVLVRAGIKTVPVWTPRMALHTNAVVAGLSPLTELTPLIGGTVVPKYPLFGRKAFHMHGKDIMPAFQPEDVPWRIAAGAEFFTEYVPRDTEYRVWVYRRRMLGTYEKVMMYPDKYRFIGCNYRNGFAFKYVPTEVAPVPAIEAAAASVTALGLDFGAVDILRGKDGHYHVLEVNTAPGVAGLTREGIKKLAAKIAKWVELGYVNRST